MPVTAAAQQAREYQIKAAYIYNFAMYLQWPAESFQGEKAPFVIGVLGTSPIQKHLETIARAKKVHDREIICRPIEDLDAISDCHLVYLSDAVEDEQINRVVEMCSGKPIVLVGESSDVVTQGGSIRFLLSQNRIRFQIAVQSTRRRGLKISSRLLQVAEVVDR